ncbi:MAG: arsenic resistance N-acetyltransferase ArsN2 [bacterium]
MEEIEFAFADSVEVEAIGRLLKRCGLPYEDIANHLHHFMVAKTGNDLIGVIGLEVYEKVGLLRSLAITDDYRGRGIAKAVYTRILAYAHLQGIESLYLLTTTAEGFFSKMGFTKVERNNIPESIQATKEFQNFCPSTAVCMTKGIEKDARYYPKEVLRLQPDVLGARMWGIALEKTMFTYFEVESNCRFEIHAHESEQITMVLEGELFFEVEGRIVGVKKGEVIAIPSALPHAVFTREQFVKAVDAWSPVMEKYKK